MSSPTVEIPSAVIAALKAEAMKRIGGLEGVDMSTGEEEKKAAKPAKPIKFPEVLKNTAYNTVLFSVAFSDYWAKLQAGSNAEAYPDFLVPTFKEHEYPEWMKAYVPAESDYRSDAALMYDAVLAFAAGSVTHLVGWPGTGKSNGLPVQIAQRLGLPLLRLGLNKKGMMFDDLIGREAIMQGAEGMHTGHKDGMLIGWVDQPSIILADEFSRANSEISNGLMSFMERNGCLIVENRSTPVIRRHEHCWIIASDNVKGLGDGGGRFVGTDMVDGAVLDRFEVTLEVDYLPEEDQRALVVEWFPGFPEDVAKRIVQFGKQIQDGYKKEQLPLSFSPRSLKEVARYTCLHKSPAVAVRKVVLAKYAEESDVEAVRTMFRTAFGYAL